VECLFEMAARGKNEKKATIDKVIILCSNET
jgi:hypothetical protein